MGADGVGDADGPRLRAPKDREFKAWVRRLWRQFAISKKVDAQLAPTTEPGTVGTVDDIGPHYVLRVDPKLDYVHAMDVLMHEWAHICRYEDDPASFDLHDDAFWVMFGAIYRKVLE